MNRTSAFGAVLLGLGLGILLSRLLPGSTWLWPFGLILAGLLMWRRLGAAILPPLLIAISLVLAVSGGARMLPRLDSLATGGEGRVLGSFESSGAQEEAWREAQRVVVLNSVGDIRVSAADELNVRVSYRRSRGRNRAPEALQASYDPISRTLSVIGLEPSLPENARRGLSAEMELSLPAGVQLEASTEVGTLEVSGMGDTSLSTRVGDISASDVSGDLSARSDVGSVTITNAARAVTARTRVGSLTLMFDAPLGAALQAETDVGDVSLSLPAASNVTVRAVSQLRNFAGDLERVTASERRLNLGAGEHQVSLSSRVGKIEVRTR